MTYSSSLKIALCCASLVLVGARPHALIGAWRAKSGPMTLEMAFASDHTFSFSVQMDPAYPPHPPIFGKWRLDGERLFIYWHPDNGPVKAPIAKLTDATLIVTLGDAKQYAFRRFSR
jgi:hypothetical protein